MHGPKLMLNATRKVASKVYLQVFFLFPCSYQLHHALSLQLFMRLNVIGNFMQWGKRLLN